MGKGFFDPVIIRRQMTVMLLDSRNFVPEPNSHFVDAFASGNEEACECVSHHVGRHPLTALPLHVGRERQTKVVTVKGPTWRNLRFQHERMWHPVVVEKRAESESERDCPFLPVLEIHRRRFAQVEESRVHVEPEGARLNDFLKPQASVKTAEEDKSQILVRRVGDQSISKLKGAEVFSSATKTANQAHAFRRVRTGDPDDLNAHLKKARTVITRAVEADARAMASS